MQGLTPNHWRPYSRRAQLVRYLIPDVDWTLHVDAELKLVASVKKHLGLFRGAALKREAEIAGILAEYVPPGGVIYDVGANIGLYSIVFARNRTRRVVSFEPSAEALRFLKRNVEINDLHNVDVRQIVLSDHAGQCLFHIDDVTTATSHVCAPGEAGVELACADLDTYAGIHRLAPPDLIKLDVEGHEEAIIRGMAGTLRRHRPQIYLEGGIRDEYGDIRAMRQIEQAGYEIFDLRKEKRLAPSAGEYAFVAVPI
jgi:FkbM family methyltransferase